MKANKLLGMIKCNFIDRSKATVLTLYESLIRPHLEYWSQVWNPHLAKDIKLIHCVQRRATKLVHGIQTWKYDDRLKFLGLTRLDKRRNRHRASTSIYSLTFCIHFLLPERHQRNPAVHATAVMLRTPPVDGQSPASQPRPLPIYGAQFWEHPPSPASQRPAARADPAQPAARTMSSYRGMDTSL